MFTKLFFSTTPIPYARMYATNDEPKKYAASDLVYYLNRSKECRDKVNEPLLIDARMDDRFGFNRILHYKNLLGDLPPIISISLTKQEKAIVSIVLNSLNDKYELNMSNHENYMDTIEERIRTLKTYNDDYGKNHFYYLSLESALLETAKELVPDASWKDCRSLFNDLFTSTNKELNQDTSPRFE